MVECLYDAATHTYTKNGQRCVSVTDCLKEAGLVEAFGTEFHLSRGNATHAAIQYDIEDDLDPASVAPEARPYYRAGMNFLADIGSPRVVALERPLFHPVLPIAGKPDVVLRPLGRLTIVDWQSGGMSKSKGPQTAGYEWLIDKPCQRWGVQLLPTERYRLHPFRDLQDRTMFLVAAYKALTARGIDAKALFGVYLTDEQVTHYIQTWKENHGYRTS